MVSYALPIPAEIRKQILFFTADIVTLTLTVNATSMRWLLNRMGFTKVPSAKVLLNYSIRKAIKDVTNRYYEKLRKRDVLTDTNWNIIHTFYHEQKKM